MRTTDEYVNQFTIMQYWQMKCAGGCKDATLGPEVGQIGPKCDKSGTF